MNSQLDILLKNSKKNPKNSIFFINMRYGIIFRKLMKKKIADICRSFRFISFASKWGCKRRYIWQPWFHYLVPNWFILLENRLCDGIKNSITTRRKGRVPDRATHTWLVEDRKKKKPVNAVKLQPVAAKIPSVRVSNSGRRKIIVMNVVGLLCDIRHLHDRRE
jgi:hypothetical protein